MRFSKKVLNRWPVIVACLVVAGLSVGTAAGAARTQLRLTASVANQQSVMVAGPIRVDLNQEIAPGLTASIEPKVAGAWREERTLLGVAAVTFRPSGRFQAGQQYRLHLDGMKRVLTGKRLPALTQTFKTQEAAQIQSIYPDEGTKDVSASPRFKVTLTTPNAGIRDLQPTLSPAVPLKLISTNDQDYVWGPENPLKQGEFYTFTLDDSRIPDPARRKLASKGFQVVTEPKIVSARSGAYFSPGQVVELVFDQPVLPDASFFVFGLPGKSTWKDERTLLFTPESLKPGETYTYKIKGGLKTKVGGVLEADRDFSFSTTGQVSGGASPGGGGHGLSVPIKITFDQATDHASAQANFSITPAVPGSFSWSGNTMTFSPSGLAYQTTYAYQVAPGVAPVWGLPNSRAISGSFSTVLQTIKLNVPVYKQSFDNTCEVTALKMALEYRGIRASEMDIVGRMGYNPRSRDTATNSWDNPNEMFVGSVNGNQSISSYGVHAPPIASAARSFGRNATLHYGLSAQFIATRIHEGNPVIFWGHSYAARLDSWNSPSGVVQAWMNSHARVVVGVKGRPDAPEGFYINDSWGGRSFYWSAGELMANINTLGSLSNQGVVVY